MLRPQRGSSPVVTECSQASFAFGQHFRREVVARFDGGAITSDAGGLLLRETDRRIGLLGRLAACLEDRRDPQRIEHRVGELVWQRVYALALGYEDLNDHDPLRWDPLLALLAGKADLEGQDRKRERSSDGVDRYQKVRCDTAAVDRLLLDVFVEAHDEAPQEIVLDLDVTDTPLHGEQQGRFFHGY